MLQSDTLVTLVLAVGLRTLSDASRLSIPLIVTDVELKWKLRWPWMHRLRQAQLLRGGSLPRVVVSLAKFSEYFVSSPILCAWVARQVKNARSYFATSR